MNPSIGLMFLQGYVATPSALRTLAPDLVTQLADQLEAARPRPEAIAAPDAGDERWARHCAAC